MRFSVFLIAALLAAPMPAFAEDWAALANHAYQRLVTEPANPDQLNLYGYYLMRARALPEAEAALRKSVALRPGFTVAWNNLGAVYMHLERFSDAERCFRTALAADVSNSKAMYNLAVARFKQGAYKEALEIYLELRKKDRAYVDMRTDPAKAERELDAALKADPNNPFLRTVKQRYEKLRQEKDDDPWRF